MVLASGEVQQLGVVDAARVRFGEEAKPEGAYAGRRLLFRDEEPAFEFSFWCGTCQFLFKRLVGSNETVSLADLQDRLSAGLEDLDPDVVRRFAELLEAGSYLPLFLQVSPRLVRPVEPGDYFAEEQITTWGIEAFWGRGRGRALLVAIRRLIRVEPAT